MEVQNNTPGSDSPTDGLSPDALAFWIALSRVTGIGPVGFRALLSYFHDDVETAWKAGRTELARAGIARRAIENLLNLRATINPQAELERLEKLRMRVVTWRDRLYPPLLREVDDAPPVLYLYGRLTEADRFALAVVGTRNSSTYGQQVTGIDTIAHTAALDAGGRTIAVLACGLDIVYPPVNRGLARRIVESGQGVLMSEYPPGSQPEGSNFPARNRIISGLSLGVLVVEAPERSGALITADKALKQGRDVFAIPGSILSSRSAGVNKLIQDGARPVMDVKDIIESLNLFMIPRQIEMQSILPDNAEEKKLLDLLSHDPLHIDDLIRESELAANDVIAVLTMMELKGMIRQVGSMQYILAR